MNRLALLSLVLLGGLGAPSSEPEPPKFPAVPERERELLAPFEVADDATAHQLATAIRCARRQAREIDTYLSEHTAERGEELRVFRLALLDIADRLVDRLDEQCVVERAPRIKMLAAKVEDAATQLACPVREWDVSPPPARKPIPPRHDRQKPAAVAVRCRVKHCQAKPGKLCRGHSGEAMGAIHPERQRDFERKVKA